MGAVRLSTLLMVLGVLLVLTTRRWSRWWDRRTLQQIYQAARRGELRSSVYAKVLSLVSVVLVIAGTYLAFVGR